MVADNSDDVSQALYPWRAVFGAIFLHDRMMSARAGEKNDSLTGTRLGRRLAESRPSLYSWWGPLAASLDLPEAELPLLPGAADAAFTSRVSTLVC